MQNRTLEETKKRLMQELETILNTELTESDEIRPLPDLGVDSMSLVELLIVIEKVFGIELMQSNLGAEDFRCIDSLARVICSAS
ncbi:acyl carrier protein [Thermodesulfobacteriota bacterium]